MTPAQARDRLVELRAGRPRGVGTIGVTFAGPLARLRIDNPMARNALTLGMMEDLANAVIELSAWDGAALVVESAATPSGAFCSGGHLADVQESLMQPHLGAMMATAMGSVLDGLLRLPIVSVALVDGPAIGGGAELLTAVDLRIGTPRARVQFVQTRLGVACGWGGAGRLVRLVGHARAIGLLARSESLIGQDLVKHGLFDAIVDDPLEGSRAYVAPLLDAPVDAIRAVKRQVLGDEPVAAFASVWGGPAHVAALRRKTT